MFDPLVAVILPLERSFVLNVRFLSLYLRYKESCLPCFEPSRGVEGHPVSCGQWLVWPEQVTLSEYLESPFASKR